VPDAARRPKRFAPFHVSTPLAAAVPFQTSSPVIAKIFTVALGGRPEKVRTLDQYWLDESPLASHG
ncbi:MAG: hypothetical protein ACREL1_07995, partial [bacterium]